MATNVFGIPVTDATVRLVYPNLREITPRHRAEVALRDMNANNRADNASAYVHNLKSSYGTGTTTLCTIFNATGANLSFSRLHTWEGSVWRYPIPHIVQNGQWAAFLHVRDRLMGPSKAAVVYSGLNHDNRPHDWLLCWNTPRRHFQNRVFTDIRVGGGFNSVNWNTIDGLMERQTNNHSYTWNGCFSTISIGADSSPQLVAIVTLSGLENLARDNLAAVLPSLDSKYVDDDGDEDGEEAAAAAAAPPSE